MEARVGVEAANLTGATGFNGEKEDFEGVSVLDYDNIVDRNEELRLLQADHMLTVWVNSTETADGTVEGVASLSAAPSPSDVVSSGTSSTSIPPDDAVGRGGSDDTIDLIGRVMHAVAHAPFSDGATQLGGGGSAGDDSYTLDMFPAEFGRFHPRDELFLNGDIRVWNIDDAGVHVTFQGQHVYGVLSG